MSKLQIIPLGGMGEVTQNMYLYVYEDEILIVDCGIGFPSRQMPGVDILIPDTNHLHKLLDSGKKIVTMILTHGHDDHIAATPYILPELPEFPILASALTAGFAEQRMLDGKVSRAIDRPADGVWRKISQHFEVMPIKVTHSVPDTRHYAIKTPVGVIYHGSDFKLDKAPVDGVLSDEETMGRLGKEGILCALVDSLRVERPDWVKSESETGPALKRHMANTKGRIVVTLMSSHIHRIQQTVDIALELGRKIVFVGRSVEQNVEIALRLKKLHLPSSSIVDKRKISEVPDKNLCVIIAGSQGQEGSSLMRAVYGEHPVINFTKDDKVIFSADAIPGNELPYFDAVDELCRNRVDVIYPDIEKDIHQSGHAGALEQQHLVKLLQPQYVMPIGGADRHRIKFIEFVAEPLSIPENRVLIPDHGEVIELSEGQAEFGEKLMLKPRIVDGLGIGDVGPKVLSDRRALSEAGMIVILLNRVNGRLDFDNIGIISRGFVFMKEADEVINFIKETTVDVIRQLPKKANDDELKRVVEKRLSRRLFKVIRREPMIVVEILEQRHSKNHSKKRS